jgi:hypothetical protein
MQEQKLFKFLYCEIWTWKRRRESDSYTVADA